MLFFWTETARGSVSQSAQFKVQHQQQAPDAGKLGL